VRLWLINSGVNFRDLNIFNILLKAGGVVDINKILCCSIGLSMLFSSEYESYILALIVANTILSDKIVANNSGSVHN
jgi:hypothetical protein